MSLILLEALGAMVVLIAIVWWTMFAGRAHGELPTHEDDKKIDAAIEEVKHEPPHA